MRTRLPVLAVLALASLAAAPAAGASAIVVVAEDPGFSASADSEERRSLVRPLSAIIRFESVSGVDDVSWGLHLRCGF
jgi:hypothetical protein